MVHLLVGFSQKVGSLCLVLGVCFNWGLLVKGLSRLHCLLVAHINGTDELFDI